MTSTSTKRQRELDLLEALSRKRVHLDPVPPSEYPSFGENSFPMRLVDMIRAHDDDQSLLSCQTQALFASSVTIGNEKFLRSYHRSLASQQRVSVVTEIDGREIWLVDVLGSNPIYDASAGGREIHVLPEIQMSPPGPKLAMRNDPIRGRIDPRQLLSLPSLSTIRQAFPGSIGVRILMSGFITILFPSQKDLEKSWSHEVYDSMGALRLTYAVAEYEPTATVTAGYGTSVTATKSEGLSNFGCLGLRIRLQNGQEAITTTTHAFVKVMHQAPSRLRLGVSEVYMKTKKALTEMKPIKALLETPAVAQVRQTLGQTPLGQKVWIAGTDELVGTITQTYDPHPAAHFPFPTGFHHDLSLICGEKLPNITNPPGFPVVTGWASCEEALRGEPVFICRNNVSTGAWRSLEGRGMSGEAQRAVVVGSEFTWEKNAFCQNASILWRTNHDVDTARTFSGSVLCCGKPTDPTARAIVFQNFQARLKEEHVRDDHRQELDSTPATFKGGFVLPDEISSAAIVMEPRVGPEAFQSLPVRVRVSEEEPRRSISGV